LAVFGVATRHIVSQPSAASSLLLLAPGLVAAYLLRPGEHAMARRLLVTPRLLLIISAAITFAAAAVLIALYPEVPVVHCPGSALPKCLELQARASKPHPSGDLVSSLRGLAGGAAAIFLLLAVSVIIPRPRSNDRFYRHRAD
jgi:hypothetical protein